MVSLLEQYETETQSPIGLVGDSSSDMNPVGIIFEHLFLYLKHSNKYQIVSSRLHSSIPKPGRE